MSNVTSNNSTFSSFAETFKNGAVTMKNRFSGALTFAKAESASDVPVTKPWHPSSASTPQVPPGIQVPKHLQRQQAVRKVRRVPPPRIPVELEEAHSNSTPIKSSTPASEITGSEFVVVSRKCSVQRRDPPPPYFRVPRPVRSPQVSEKIDAPSTSSIPPPTYEDCLTLTLRESPVAKAINGLKANRVIGHGAFSKVYDAEIGTTGKHMAVKLLDKAKIMNEFGEPGLETIMQEQAILRKIAELEIEGCAKLLLSAHDEQFAIVGTECCPLGDISKELKRSGRLPERFASYIFASVALTLEKLAANNIVHRDMKPHNVVWANDGKPKIIDFEAYLAPEVARRENYGPEVDEWSWEVAHFEMVTGVLPFGHLGAAAAKEPLNILPFHRLSEDAEDYFRKVLDKNRETRMAWREARNHPYIKKMVADISNGRITTPPFVPIQPAAVSLGFVFTIPSGSAYAPGQDPHPDFSYQAPDLYTPTISTTSFAAKLAIGKRSASTFLSKTLTKGPDSPLQTLPTVATPTTGTSMSQSVKTSSMDPSKPVPKCDCEDKRVAEQEK
ncbi:kinase-like protein [Stereum hirsutum FP-91666 SS1]|uniref:kinase-like protein n=1 Tax=Stereum hirsutum (strain FP-91666) TaxID=721885 RepID=UPI000444A626|nr:kinase-like protein [Stereum hirsutum FP-91666 SS1]EIM85111.1 kinase-like protein [Stereum hirsutum FP-91666 SS1]